MAWKECDRVSERLEFLKLATVEGTNFSQLCRRFNVSRKTGYKWLKRFRENGEADLADQCRRPLHSPTKTSAEVERLILEVRQAHPAWGGRKIRQYLKSQGASPPAASTITTILHRHNCISPEESSQHGAFTRFERDQPNDLWQLDFKGEFNLSGGGKCYPLTLLDDHSRYAVAVEACNNQTGSTVKDRLCKAMHRYGIPRSIYVDNGTPWGTPFRHTRHTRLSAWLMRHDIEVIHGRPYHPQGRGKLERFHRTIKLEVLQGRQFDDLARVQCAFDPWRRMYNHERPHEALGLNVPVSRYRSSDRDFRERLSPYEYSAHFHTRKANSRGQFRFQSIMYRISEAFVDERLGLLPTTQDGLWDIYYCRFLIGQLDQRTGVTRRIRSVG